MNIYKSSEVLTVQELYKTAIENRNLFHFVRDQLLAFIDIFTSAYRRQLPITAVIVSNYHPDWLGATSSAIFNASLPTSELELTILKEYGFHHWDELSFSPIPLQHHFELAIDYLLTGKFLSLRELLETNPELLHMHSHYGHKAGLIHYIGTNGIELWRQQVPENIGEMTRLLLEYGANPLMNNHIYGGTDHVASLIKSSAHSWDAGVGETLLALFPDYIIHSA